MNRDQISAYALATGYLAIGAAFFMALGWWVSWWLAGGVYVAAAGVAGWLFARRFPTTPRPW